MEITQNPKASPLQRALFLDDVTEQRSDCFQPRRRDCVLSSLTEAVFFPAAAPLLLKKLQVIYEATR